MGVCDKPIVLLNPRAVLRAITNDGRIRRWLEYMAYEYVPPDDKEILLFYPCSNVKPYYKSRLYKALYITLGKLGQDREKIHVISVSEPFGMVPEDLYSHFDRMGWYECPGLFRWWCQKNGQPYEPNLVRKCIDTLAEYVATFLTRTRKVYKARIAFVRTVSSGLRRRLDHTHANIVERASYISKVYVKLLPPISLISEIIKRRGRLAWDFYGVAHPIAQDFLLMYLRQMLDKLLKR